MKKQNSDVDWTQMQQELLQVVFSFARARDVEAASLVCRAWRAAVCASITHLQLPLSHPLLIAGPPLDLPRRATAAALRSPRSGTQQPGGAGLAHASSAAASGGAHDGGSSDGAGAGSADGGVGARNHGGGAAGAGPATLGLRPQPAHPALMSLVTSFPAVRSIMVVHNTLLHRYDARRCLAALHALWPAVQDLVILDSVSWDFPLDYEALGAMTHLTSLGLLFQGQGGMDDAGQPLYRSSMLHLRNLSELQTLRMKWIIGYDVDSFLDFEEVYMLLEAFAKHGSLRSLHFGGENINKLGAGHLASITGLQTLNLVCDARPASPVQLLQLLSMPHLTRLNLQHVCPDVAWGAHCSADPLQLLETNKEALMASPLRSLGLSLSPRCFTMVERALPLLPSLTQLQVRVTCTEEEMAMAAAFKAMMVAQPNPTLRSLKLDSVELSAQVVSAITQLTCLTALMLPHALPAPADDADQQQPNNAEAEELEVSMPHLERLARLRDLRTLVLQLDSTQDMPAAFITPSFIGALAGLPHLETLHLSTWNMLGRHPLTPGASERQRPSSAEATAAAATAAAAPPAAAEGSGDAGSGDAAAATAAAAASNGDAAAATAAGSGGDGEGAQAGQPSCGGASTSGKDDEQMQPHGGDVAAAAAADADVGGSPSPPDGGSAGSSPPGQLAGRSASCSPPPVFGSRRLYGGCKPLISIAPGAHLHPNADGCEPDATSPPGPSAPPGAGADGGGASTSAAAAAAGPSRPGPSGGLRWSPPGGGGGGAWSALRSLSLTHWPSAFQNLKDYPPLALPQGYTLDWDLLPRTLEALVLSRINLLGTVPPPHLRHVWLADCNLCHMTTNQMLRALPPGLETLVLRWLSHGQQEPEAAAPGGPAAAGAAAAAGGAGGGAGGGANSLIKVDADGVSIIAGMKDLRTLGLGGLCPSSVPRLAPLTRLRHLMLEPRQPSRDPPPENHAPRDLVLLDPLLELTTLRGLRTLWLPNWCMPIKQMLQWQQLLQAAMPLVVLRITEYDVVWTVPSPVEHVADAEGTHDLEWWHIGCWTVQ